MTATCILATMASGNTQENGMSRLVPTRRTA